MDKDSLRFVRNSLYINRQSKNNNAKYNLIVIPKKYYKWRYDCYELLVN